MQQQTARPSIPSGGYGIREHLGRVEVLPHPVPAVVADVVKTVRATQWPNQTTTDRVPETVDHLGDLAYWSTVRCLAMLNCLATGRVPAGPVLDDLLTTPKLHVHAGPWVSEEEETAWVPLQIATRLRDQLIPLPVEVADLVRGRLVHALAAWPHTTADVIADLVSVSAPTPVDGESEGNRAYGATLAARMFATWVQVPAMRWPLAAAWASANLLREWVDWGTSVAESRRAHTVGLAPYSQGLQLPVDTVLPDWADLIQKRLTDQDRAAAVTLGGTARHTIRYTTES